MATYHASPPSNCDLCNATLRMVFYDARTPLGWANCCSVCFNRQGLRTGLGRGQKYERQTDGRYLKTEG